MVREAQKTHKREKALAFWFVSLGVVLAVLSLVVVAPVAAANGNGELAAGIYRAFGIFCHQLPERSYFIDGHQLAICSRCTGLSGGFAFTLLLYPLIQSLQNPITPPRSWLILAAIPTAIDFGVNFFGFWYNTHTSRVLTGALLGSAVVFYVMPGIIDLSTRYWRTPPPKEPRVTFTLASPERIASAPSDYSAPERRIP